MQDFAHNLTPPLFKWRADVACFLDSTQTPNHRIPRIPNQVGYRLLKAPRVKPGHLPLRDPAFSQKYLQLPKHTERCKQNARPPSLVRRWKQALAHEHQKRTVNERLLTACLKSVNISLQRYPVGQSADTENEFPLPYQINPQQSSRGYVECV
jgi:hypothetical protein